MSFNRELELIAAEAASLIAEGLAAGLFFACAFVWLAVYATTAVP